MGQCGSRCLKVGISYRPSDPEGCFAQLIRKSLFCLDHKRLDYLLEHQIITTSSETHDVEVFMHFLMGRTSILAM